MPETWVPKVKLSNCRVVRESQVCDEDVWWEIPANGVCQIIDPMRNFWDVQSTESVAADFVFDCKNLIAAPGYIDIQINGGFGVDFTMLQDPSEDPHGGIQAVAHKILRHGCTSFCPTVITSTPQTYRKTIAKLKEYKQVQDKLRAARATRLSGGNGRPEWKDGGAVACMLGTHLEGPFISIKGAHPEELIRVEGLAQGFGEVQKMYGELDSVCLLTLAPELPGALATIEQLTRAGVTVSVGHSGAQLADGVEGMKAGARLITHLFNAMTTFHHRDPGLVGLLGVTELHGSFFYGLIADGIHAHPASVKIASAAYPGGVVLVTDAMAAMGLPDGDYNLGTIAVTIVNGHVTVAGTNTLAGAVTGIDQCVRNFRKFTQCSVVEAVNAATLHPAQCLGISNRKGSLSIGRDADVILLDDELEVHAVFVNGLLTWCKEGSIRLTCVEKSYDYDFAKSLKPVAIAEPPGPLVSFFRRSNL
jgi:N-acetylglucosamine-6-phosphate deacetylase